jgi:hypothetical protein
LFSRFGGAYLGLGLPVTRSKNVPDPLRPVVGRADRSDAPRRHEHRTDEPDDHFANLGSLLKQRRILIFRETAAIVSRAEMRPGFVQAAKRVSEEGNELLLRASPKAFGDI